MRFQFFCDRFGLLYTFVLLTSLFWLTTNIYAQTLHASLSTGWKSIQQDALRENLAYLASSKLEGRLASSRGDSRGVTWLVDSLRQAGLKPANGKSYLQPFSVIEYVSDDKKSLLMLERGHKRSVWKKPDAEIEFDRDCNLQSGVVFAGYGITAPELNYDDYQGLDVTGKIVMVFEHEPQETNPASLFNGLGNTPYATTRIKALNAQKHGAVAILVVPEPNRKHPSNQERRSHIGSEVRTNPLPSMALINNELKLPVVILSDKSANAIAGSLSLSKLQSVIDQTLKPQSRVIPGVKISLQTRLLSRTTAVTNNVVALLEGADPDLKNETIIISAHHDHDGYSGRKIWHGADDNASGTVGVLALAKALAVNSTAKTGVKPKRSLLFVIFGAEERGLLGSYYMTSHPLRPLKTTRAMINFDMIGRNEASSLQTKGLIAIPRNTHNHLNLIGAHFSPDYDKVVREENRYVGLDIDDRFDNENALNTFFRSDQFPFIMHDIPAFWWFTGFHPDYHHTTDTAEKINYQKMQKILRLAYLTAYQFANNDTSPRFVSHPHP